MDNRLREIRQEKKYSQKKVSEDTGIPQNTLSNYENQKRSPSQIIWKVLAEYYGVGVEWLQGTSDDKADFEGWEDATGYSKDELMNEMNNLSKIGYLTGDIQKDIGIAVATLEGQAGGHGELSAINKAISLLSSITGKIEKDYFFDPNKKFDDSDNLDGLLLRSQKNGFGSKYYYSDMDPELMTLIQENITQSKRILSVSASALRSARSTGYIDDQTALLETIFDDFKQQIFKSINKKLESNDDNS